MHLTHLLCSLVRSPALLGVPRLGTRVTGPALDRWVLVWGRATWIGLGMMGRVTLARILWCWGRGVALVMLLSLLVLLLLLLVQSCCRSRRRSLLVLLLF